MVSPNRSRLAVDLGGPWRLYQPADLPGWDMLGTVTRSDGTGALARNRRTGIYAMINAGAVRSLPQHKITAALHGQG